MKRGILLWLLGAFTLAQAQDNQNIQIAKLESGSYPVYKTTEKGYNKYLFQKATKNWPVEFYKEGDQCGKMLIKRVGLIEEFYEADLPAYPAYYHGSETIVTTVIDKKIFYYSWTAAKGADIKYILTQGKPGKYVDEKALLDNYRRTIKANQTGARDERKEANAALAAKEAEENTLKGKSIKSIELKLVNPPAKVGMLTVVSIGMEVTLTNGKVLKTKNLGGKTPYTDFDSKVKGGAYSGGDFKVANDSRQIPNDKIEVEVWSKYDTKARATIEHPLNYKNDIFYHYQGGGGSLGRANVVGKSPHGGNGRDGRSVNVHAESLTINGEPVIKATITDAMSGEVLAEAKIHQENQIEINVSGGNGGNGCDGDYASSGNGGNGGDGGNGGSVMLSGSGASIIDLDVDTSGGSAGQGGRPKNRNYNSAGRNGSRGSNGSFIK